MTCFVIELFYWSLIFSCTSYFEVIDVLCIPVAYVSLKFCMVLRIILDLFLLGIFGAEIMLGEFENTDVMIGS